MGVGYSIPKRVQMILGELGENTFEKALKVQRKGPKCSMGRSQRSVRFQWVAKVLGGKAIHSGVEGGNHLHPVTRWTEMDWILVYGTKMANRQRGFNETCVSWWRKCLLCNASRLSQMADLGNESLTSDDEEACFGGVWTLEGWQNWSWEAGK